MYVCMYMYVCTYVRMGDIDIVVRDVKQRYQAIINLTVSVLKTVC